MKYYVFKKKFLLTILLSSVFYLCPSLSQAAEFNGARFADTYTDEGKVMRLQGMGAKYMFFIKVFVAGLYIDQRAAANDVLTDVPRRLEVAYFFSIPAVKLARETRRQIQLNTTAHEYARIKARVDVMDHYFVDIKPGDRYALTYLPGLGTKFTYNGKPLGLIQGEDFAKALFAVWVGGHPLDNHLKSHLLGTTP